MQKLLKYSLILWLLSVPLSLPYSLKVAPGSTSFLLSGIYLSDLTSLVFLIVLFFYFYSYKGSFSLLKNILLKKQSVNFVLLLFLVFICLSVFWSGEPLLSLLLGLRMVIFFLVLFSVAYFFSLSSKIKRLFLYIFVFLGVFESLIGLLQVVFSRSLGFYLLGESHLGPEVLGLARFPLLGHDFLRAYGTLPHPNVLGGFFLFTISATLTLINLEKSNTKNTEKYKQCVIPAKAGTQENNKQHYCLFILIRMVQTGKNCKSVENIALFIQFIGLILTFSRSALLGLILMAVLNLKTIRSVFEKFKKKSVVVSAILILIAFSFLLRGSVYNFIFLKGESIELRMELAKASEKRFLSSPLLGRGWGTGPIELSAFSDYPFYFFEHQPVHNIYLLVLSDLGVTGFLIFAVFLIGIAVRVKLSEKKTLIWGSLFLAYLFIGIFDHYLLTLPQGIFIFLGSALIFLAEERRIGKKQLGK